jgi:hypothetical protein
MHDWHEVPDLLRGCAHDDMIDCDAIRPTLVAFAGERPLLLTRMRPFGRREADEAVTEVLDVVAALGADRLAMSFGGIARWPDDLTGIDDRITDDDVREVLTIIIVDDAAIDAGPHCTLTAVKRRGGEVIWGASVTTQAVCGWLTARLVACVARLPQRESDAEVSAKVIRCMARGHELFLPGGAGPPGVRSRAERDDEAVPTTPH